MSSCWVWLEQGSALCPAWSLLANAHTMTRSMHRTRAHIRSLLTSKMGARRNCGPLSPDLWQTKTNARVIEKRCLSSAVLCTSHYKQTLASWGVFWFITKERFTHGATVPAAFHVQSRAPLHDTSANRLCVCPVPLAGAQACRAHEIWTMVPAPTDLVHRCR